ncbi:PEPxxWA-CTERM sorting domain-containing protein [Phenylobacterium sp.]|jgi:hypothetical protein|uniref:PEPxxWA-CTERM sorting domain-containing protein n=1 Tax=Phenylobacterium sp. TaxID=1871053 RepID=UPI0039C96F18
MGKLWCWALSAVAISWALPVGATTTFDFTGSVQSWAVPTTGIYQIDAWGAQGGGNQTFPGGAGAHVGGQITLAAGTSLSLVVGGAGKWGGGNYAYGGGGASWIFVPDASDPLLVAGGGGGSSWIGYPVHGGGAGQITTGNGFGGQGADGGGGGGWLGPGSDGGPPRNFAQGDFPIGTGGQGPGSFLGGNTTGCDNGHPYECGTEQGTGGFGGGGGAGWNVGGGGGGYTGGDSSTVHGGTGGSSYVAAAFTNTTQEAGSHLGNGILTIDFIEAVDSVPEPAAWALMIVGFGVAGAALRRRRTGHAPGLLDKARHVRGGAG